ncbi:MAG: ATP-dependent DNA helicase [Pseudomonadota bacterium]|nr:ATP-dependent DNA helicase [Pseudomonadota bacterium]
MDMIASAFAASGPLAQALPDYKPRAQQIEMAAAIANAIERQTVLIAEAGTGTGKTFAYLVPALLLGGKVIISTGTKTLQDQLFDRDIPSVRKALKVPVKVALLKGRANYVCHYYLDRAQHEGRFMSRSDVHSLQEIAAFIRVTNTGDKAELGSVPETSAVWSQVTSTRDNCLGQDCPFHRDCFVLKARKAALEADIVVINHHLFFADVILRDEGSGELLPACNTVIFDEAHQLPEVATLFFGESVSSAQLVELARDTRVEAAGGAKDFAALPKAADDLERTARELRLAFPPLSGANSRLQSRALQQHLEFLPSLEKLASVLAGFSELLQSQAERSEGLKNCSARTMEIRQRLQRWRDEGDANRVRWAELFAQSVQLNAAPLEIAEIFQRQLASHPKAWIFTSATLAVRDDFRHYQSEMGLADAVTRSWGSPFDFERQALLYVPVNMPEPNSPEYTRAVVAAALPVVMAAGGRAFLLFTSLRAMNEARELVQEHFAEHGIKYSLLVQGDRPKAELLSRFRELGNAVLIGSHSFWEGVDVKGEALSIVVIDRLPFSPPDDPVVAARIEALNKLGRSAFMEYQLPEAIITLKQGAGRLIRDETDRGVLMICDPRLISKGYGRRIWQSLPPMKRTRDLAEVEAFFRAPSSGSG